MQSSNEGEDIFFDAHESIRISVDSLSLEDVAVKNKELELREFEYELCSRELMSVKERRRRFLCKMGFVEFVSSTSTSGHSQDWEEAKGDRLEDHLDMRRIKESSGALLDSLSHSDSDRHKDSICCISDLDSGKKFVIHDLGQDGKFSMLREVGSDKLMTLEEFEMFLGLSCSVQKLLRREADPYGEKTDCGLDVKKKKSRSWLKSFSKRRHAMGMCKFDVSIKNSKISRSMRTRVQQHRKRCMEFTALFLCQEIQGHKGLIRTMKFSPSGCYLATGGEDCVVRIWQIREAETSCKCSTAEISPKFVDKAKGAKLMLGKSRSSAPAIFPKWAFKIEETPFQELHGHSSDILDLSWSESDCLLTSSIDKTVRMWKVGCEGCLKVFQHKDYVTCVQFNPMDDGYFISGSIDGKVRIWGISENRVVNWVDVREIVTAICYRPDGKGFVVGSITGSCRFYDHSDESMQMGIQFCVKGKKKSAGKRISSLQFSPEDSQKLLITSADSKLRIFRGLDVIHKFRGPWKINQLTASFTSDGRHIFSVAEDSHVYIWNYDGFGGKLSKGAKSTHSRELFFSEGASVAVPWPGMNNKGSSVGDDSPTISSLQQKFLESSTCLRNADCFSLGSWLFSDGSLRGTATWPEEKLPSITEPSVPTENCDRHQHCHGLTSVAVTWSQVIVTASNGGAIRSFHNYGLPVRL